MALTDVGCRGYERFAEWTRTALGVTGAGGRHVEERRHNILRTRRCRRTAPARRVLRTLARIPLGRSGWTLSQTIETETHAHRARNRLRLTPARTHGLAPLAPAV
jgi:hypothetical protein